MTVTALRFPLQPLLLSGVRYHRYYLQVSVTTVTAFSFPLRPLPFSGLAVMTVTAFRSRVWGLWSRVWSNGFQVVSLIM